MAILKVKDAKGNVTEIPAIRGKSAYQYAVDGGYTGTEAEFAEKLATECISKNQGAENVGKILVVGTDGNLTLTDMPEGGASGDVIGVLDDSNNILLSGKLENGKYTLKYENTDGTYTDIGILEIGAIEDPDTPTYTNLLPTSTKADGTEFVGTHANGGDGYEYGVRIKGSTGAEESVSAQVYSTGFMRIDPIATANVGLKIYVENVTASATANYNMLALYNSSHGFLKSTAIAETGYAAVKLVDGVWEIDISQITSSQDIYYFRMCFGVISENTEIKVERNGVLV